MTQRFTAVLLLFAALLLGITNCKEGLPYPPDEITIESIAVKDSAIVQDSTTKEEPPIITPPSEDKQKTASIKFFAGEFGAFPDNFSGVFTNSAGSPFDASLIKTPIPDEQHIFIGWNKEIPSQFPDNDLIVIAKYDTKPKVTITFVAGTNGKFPANSKTKITGYIGAAFDKSSAPTPEPNEGFQFEYWSTDVLPDVFPDKDQTITAVFEHAYVDLGLSVRWATCNLGATKPEGYGDYYAWGETKPQTSKTYSWATYKWMDKSVNDYNGITKYTLADGQTAGIWYDDDKFVGDNKSQLDITDDAAHVDWGGQWRMPTKQECQELHDNCTWTWKPFQQGYEVQSRINGNIVFFPAADCYEGAQRNSLKQDGYYWSSTLYPTEVDAAWAIGFRPDIVDFKGYFRNLGRSIRAVLPKNK